MCIGTGVVVGLEDILVNPADSLIRTRSFRLRHMVLMILAIFVVCTNLRTSITSVSPLLGDIERGLGLNAAEASLLTSLPVFCMGIFAPLAAGVGNRIGLSRTIFWSIGLIGIATAARMAAVSAIPLILTSAFAGLGIAIAGPAMSGFIKQQFPKRAPIMMGVYTGGLGIGATISSGLSIPLKNAFGGSWSASLSFWAIFAVVGLLIWLPFLRQGRSESSTIRTSRPSSLPWRKPQAWLLVVLFGLQSGLYYAMAAFFAPALEQLGMSALHAADMMTLFSLVNMVTGILLPIAMHRGGSRIPWLIACGVLMLIGAILLAWLPTAVSPWLIAVILGVGSGGSFTLTLILPLDFTNRGEETSAWTAMMQCGGYIMSAFVPILAGTIRDVEGTYTGMFIGLAAISLLFCAMCFLLPRRRLTS